MSAKKSKTFFKTLTAILVLLLFFGGYYISLVAAQRTGR